MNILRKILGIFLLILSLFLILAAISSLIHTITGIPIESGAERLGYIFGCEFFVLLIVLLIYFITKKAIGFLKNKPQNTINEIDKIGQS